jgi:ATP phosphoribosyltransferase
MSGETAMKFLPILAALVALSTPAMAQDATTCAKQHAQYETEFREAIMKVIEVRTDKAARCNVGRNAMTVLDKMAANAEACPALGEKRPEDDSGAMKLLRPGETVKDMVARRKAAFERDCGK